jgi:hypothetical protein
MAFIKFLEHIHCFFIMYNSNYGAGYGGMGSYGSYGSTGSYGSSYGMGSTLGGMRNLQNNPQNNNQQPNP